MHRVPSAPLPEDPRRRKQTGVTFIEVMIVVAIVAILVAVAVPGFKRFLSNQRASGAVNDLAHDIALARIEALKRSRRVYVAPLGDHWRDGWAVFVDRNDNRRFDAPVKPGDPDADEVVATHGPLHASVTVTNSSGAATEPFLDQGKPSRPYVMFDGSGFPRRRNGALNIGGLAVTAGSGADRSIRTLCLASYGRVRIIRDVARCS